MPAVIPAQGRLGLMKAHSRDAQFSSLRTSPPIVMDITQALEDSGAELTTTNTLRYAMLLVEHDGLSAAVLDHALGDGNSSLLCARLKERGIPVHSSVMDVAAALPKKRRAPRSVPSSAAVGGKGRRNLLAYKRNAAPGRGRPDAAIMGRPP